MAVLPLLIPLEGFDHGGFLEPLIGLGGFLVVVAILITGLLLLRRFGFLPHMPSSVFGRRPSPEDSARRLLAERMARGEISGEEFLERASLLNWTPGSDLYPNRAIRRS